MSRELLKNMPALRLKAIETSENTLDLIEEELGIGVYELAEKLEEFAYEKLRELREEALNNKK